jgi:hypothetical protein
LAFAIVSYEEIIPGEGISPLFGTIVLYDQLRKNLLNKNPNLCYRLISNIIAVEFTESGTTAKSARHCCEPNAEFVIKVLLSGELIPLLQATKTIRAGEEITVDYARHSNPKLFKIKVLSISDFAVSDCAAAQTVVALLTWRQHPMTSPPHLVSSSLVNFPASVFDS